MRTTFLLLVIALSNSAAQADCLQWGRDQQGTRVCIMDDAFNRNPIIPETQCGALTGCDDVSVTGGPAPKCEDGWTAVMVPAGSWGRFACARDLVDPK